MGDSIAAYFNGSCFRNETLDKEGWPYYETTYDVDIEIRALINSELVSFSKNILDHTFTETDGVWGDYHTFSPGMDIHCAPRNTVFIISPIRVGVFDGMGDFQLMVSGMFSGFVPYGYFRGNPVHVSCNVLMINGGVLCYGTLSVDLFVSKIRVWNYDCFLFLYEDTTSTYAVDGGNSPYKALSSPGSYTIYKLTPSASDISISSVLTFSGFGNPAYIWYSKNWETIVVKGSTAEDGIYRYSSSGYTQIQSGFTDIEPVYISPDGNVVATTTKIYIEGETTVRS